MSSIKGRIGLRSPFETIKKQISWLLFTSILLAITKQITQNLKERGTFVSSIYGLLCYKHKKHWTKSMTCSTEHQNWLTWGTNMGNLTTKSLKYCDLFPWTCDLFPWEAEQSSILFFVLGTFTCGDVNWSNSEIFHHKAKRESSLSQNYFNIQEKEKCVIRGQCLCIYARPVIWPTVQKSLPTLIQSALEI